MNNRGDWAQGAAKWAAVGLLGTASIGGVAWHVMTRPEPLHPQPISTPAAEPIIAATPILVRPALPAPPQPVEHGLVRIGLEPLTPEAPAQARPALLATRPGIALPASEVTNPAPPESPRPARVNPAPEPAPGLARREPQPAPQQATPARVAPQRTADVPTRRLNLNTATQAQLELLPGIGPALAKRIIDHRTARGPFRNVDELDNVPGIGPATMNRLRPLVTVEGTPR